MTSVKDIIIVSIILFIIGLSIVFIVKIGHNINSQLLLTPIINDSAPAKSVITHVDAAINMSDYLYLSLFIAFAISVIIFGWLVSGTTIMAPIYFFILILFTFISGIIQLVWIEIASSGQLTTTIAILPITNYILSHLAFFTAILGLLGILTMYAKPYVSDSAGVYQ